MAKSSQGSNSMLVWIAIRTESLVRVAARRGIAAIANPSANLLIIAADQILLKVIPKLSFDLSDTLLLRV
jgi:hypothetical protein